MLQHLLVETAPARRASSSLYSKLAICIVPISVVSTQTFHRKLPNYLNRDTVFRFYRSLNFLHFGFLGTKLPEAYDNAEI